MKENKELYLELYSDPRFVALVKEIMKRRPTLPPHDPKQDNTEIWKSASAEQRGFDIWTIFLRVPEELNE